MNKTGRTLQSNNEMTLVTIKTEETSGNSNDKTTEATTLEVFTFISLVTTSEEGKLKEIPQSEESLMTRTEEFKTSSSESSKSGANIEKSGENAETSVENTKKAEEEIEKSYQKTTEASNFENKKADPEFLVTTSKNFVPSTEELFTFHSITTSTIPNKISVSTLIDFPTTKIDQNSFSSPSPSKMFDENSLIFTISTSTSTISPISTDFFSENPKNILQPTTEKFEITSNFPSLEGDSINLTESPLDSQEMEDEMKDFNHRKGTTSHSKVKDDEENDEKLENEVENETENSLDPTTPQDDLGLMLEGGRDDNSVKVADSEKENEENLTLSTLKNPSKYPEIFTKPSQIENNLETTTKPKHFLYYYFITAIKTNESSSKENENSTNVGGDQSMFMGIPGEHSCDVHQS